MKKLLVIIVTLVSAAHSARSQVEVKASPSQTVELMNVMMSLTGEPLFNQRNVWPEYRSLVDSYFDRYRDHSAIKFIVRQLFKKSLVNMVTPADIGVNSDIIDGNFVYYGGQDWSDRTRDKFVEEVNKFYRDTNFQLFWEAARDRAYPLVEGTFNDRIIPKLNLAWLNDFIPVEQTMNYGLTISYLCGSYNFGVAANGIPNPVIGIFDINQFVEPTPFVLYRYPAVILHEYLHPFCNPLIDKYYSELEGAGEVIFPAIREHMTARSYGQWRYVLYESMVRASVITFMRSDEFFMQYVDDMIEGELKAGFYWIRELSWLFLEYQADRDRYPSLDSFMPRVVDFFGQLASDAKETY